jgi:arylsulfatase A-like enzyme
VPHYELLVPEDSLAEYKGKFPETPYRGRSGRRAGYPTDYGAQETPKAAIAGMITRMDRSVGRIAALLKELKIDENTIVFFSSDNGAAEGQGAPEYFNASGGLRGLKGTLYEGGIRVPMIVHWPGKVRAGTMSDHPWYFADVMATVAELAGTKAAAGHDGISVVPTLLGEKQAGRKQQGHEFMYWESESHRAVRMGKWKGIQRMRGKGAFELYDLKADEGEALNVAGEHPGVAAKIENYLKTARRDPRPQIEPKSPAGRQYQ